MKKRVVAVFTGNRAEYGLQFPILKAIEEHAELEYRLIVSGAHLDKNFGRTLSEIESDGFKIAAEVKIDLNEDSLAATAQAIGSGVVSMSKALKEIKPDILVVYADRFEGFAAMIAGSQMGIPTAHIEGGDITEGGALDDSVRHAMTKLAHMHFTTNEEAAWRVKQMGEENWRVFNVGFPAIDLIKQNNFATPEEIATKYGIAVDKPLVLFTQHSVATQLELAGDQLQPSLDAIDRLVSEEVQVILTYPNNDAGGRKIIDLLEKFASNRNEKNLQLHRSLGRFNYHGVLNVCGKLGPGVCVGNSSSGVKETPAFGCPAVDIGNRQDGRLAGENLLRVGYSKDEIYTAIQKSLFDKRFRELCRTSPNPYGTGDAGTKIADVLSTIELGHRMITKGMTLKRDSRVQVS